jgi:hypothetical protein
MGRQLPLFVWLLVVVILLLLERVGKKQNGLGLAFGASKLKAVINSYPKGSEFILKGDYTLAIGKDRTGRCVPALKCQRTE